MRVYNPTTRGSEDQQNAGLNFKHTHLLFHFPDLSKKNDSLSHSTLLQKIKFVPQIQLASWITESGFGCGIGLRVMNGMAGW